MRISDWSSDVCSSDLRLLFLGPVAGAQGRRHFGRRAWRGNRDRRKPAPRRRAVAGAYRMSDPWTWHGGGPEAAKRRFGGGDWIDLSHGINPQPWPGADGMAVDWRRWPRSEECRVEA